MKNEDKPKQDDNCEAANAASPRPTRRQFLKGLTTGTVAIGALVPVGMRAGGSAAKNPRRDRDDNRLSVSAESVAARSSRRAAAR